MKTNFKKYGIMIIAAVLLVGVVFAGAASAGATPVTITNSTGTYDLSDGEVVYGDGGTANGTAALVEQGTEWVLTLTNFNASNMSDVPIINASVQNLTIKLVGESNLTGSYENSVSGLIYSSDKLTITTDTDGKLLVTNPAYEGNAILANDDVIIEDGTITATANGEDGYAIYAYYGNVIINGGTVTATADCDAIVADDDVIINDGTVNATAGTYAIYAQNGDIIITSVANFIANGDESAFSYDNARDFSALGNTYEYWVNATGGSEPTVQLTYAQFNNTEGNWSEGESVYTSVLIKPVSTPTPTPAYVEVNSWSQLNKSVSEWTDTETALIVAVNASINDRNSQNPEGIEVTGKVILTVNQSPAGNEAVIDGDEQGRLFKVISGNLTIIGNVSTGAVLNLTSGYIDGGFGGAISVVNGGNLTLDSYAMITNSAANLTDWYGGAVYVQDGTCTFTMNNGSIVGCSAQYGGAVENHGIFIMNGGSITGCSATICNGGAVDNDGGMFIMNGGSITGCSAAIDDGGGVYNGGYNGGTFIMNGGSITDCSAEYGGAVYIYNGTFTMNNGSIADCSAGDESGAVYISDGTFTMNNGSIADCSAEYGGGAVYIDDGTFTMNNGSIADCSAEYGGAVYIDDGTFTMNNGSIADCSAEEDGGAVENYGIFIMNGGSIADCTAEDDGGAVDNYCGTFTMNGGSIADCTAEDDGGGVCNDEGLFTMTGGSIASCSAPFGSGVDQYGTFNVTGSATISSDNEVALYAKDGEDGREYLNIIVDAGSSFTGSIQNIKLYRYASGEIVDAAAWLQHVVVENGAGLANKFQLSSDHSGYQLTASGSDLILTKKAKPSSSSKDMGSTIILTEPVTPTPVPTATPAATAVPTIATVKPTAQQTQKSPAPVFGLIAGLGAAAVLLRLRK